MKKVLVTLLALVYLTTSVGATFSMHYCMDRLVDWGLGEEQSAKKSCSYCGMAKTTDEKHCGKESKGCCKDEKKIVKLENDQKISETSFQFLKIPLEGITPVFSDYSFEYSSSLIEECPLTHGPPPRQNVTLFVLNCDFRI